MAKPRTTPLTGEEIAALAEGLDGLSAEELTERRSQLETLADEIVQAADTSRVAEAEAAADARDAVVAEQDRRATVETEAQAALAAVADRLAPPAPVAETVEVEVEVEVDPEPAPDGDPPAPEAPVVVPVVVPVVTPEPVAPAAPVAVAASGTVRPITTASRYRPAAPPEAAESAQGRAVITASGHFTDVGVRRDDEMTEGQVWEVLDRLGRRMVRNPGKGIVDDRIPVATIRRTDVPEDRQLFSRDPDGNAEKVEALVAAAKVQMRADIDQMARTGELPGVGAGALTAAVAALCAPLTPIYTIVDHTSDSTPFADSLPTMQADRGGITFSRSPAPSAVSGGYSSITATEAAVPTEKNIVEIDCPSFVDAEVEANVFRARYRNWADRFWPERTRNLANLGMAEKARQTENALLTTLIASTGVVNQPAGDDYGAFRDFFSHLERAVVEIRHAQRLTDSEPLEFHGHRSLVNTLRDDLMLGTDDPAMLSQADSTIAQHFAARGVRPFFHWDGPTVPAVAADAAALPDLPASQQWGLWVPGDVVHLDGGEINFDAVRDSTLNATNAFEALFESFDNVAVLGRYAMWVTSALCSNGSKSLGVTTKACPAGS